MKGGETFAPIDKSSLSKELPESFFTAKGERWWERVALSDKPLLATDYDGTLAPFRLDRLKAFPYAKVITLLGEIVSRGGAVVIVSGRPAEEVRELIRSDRFIIYGCHGWERWTPQAGLTRFPLTTEQKELLKKAYQGLAGLVDPDQLERKHGSLAVHWRRYPRQVQRRIELLVRQVWEPLVIPRIISLRPFSGGLELRALGWDKGRVIGWLIEENRPDLIAYLGDDDTDEDAFWEVRRWEGLTIQVRKEPHLTYAQFWLAPPHQLRVFLTSWRKVLSLKSNTGGSDGC